MSKQLNPFQKKKLRAIGAMHAGLQEKTQGLSRGLSTRRGERMTEARSELQNAQRALDQAERYAANTKNDGFIKNDLLRIRARRDDAQETVNALQEEAAAIEEQLAGSRADSDQSGRVFEKLLKFAEA
jgi:hypothetical protein